MRCTLTFELDTNGYIPNKLFENITSLINQTGCDIIRKEIQLATEIGDLGIFWDGDERSEAIIARLEAITEGSTYPYTTNKGDDYENCIKFISVEQFNEFIKQC